MTELFVNNEQVVLPDNFSTEIIEGNPFINPIGETSLDITVSLLEPWNAYIFGYLQRSNAKRDVSQALPCKLVVNTREHHGRCIVLEFSDEEVKIQLVFRNSIFTYAINEEMRLRDLNLGTAVIPSNIIGNLILTYPETDFQLLMVMDPDITYKLFSGMNMVDGDLLNRYTYVHDQVNNKYILAYGHDGESININGMFAIGDLTIKKELYSPQPYLAAIVRRVIEALGFQIGENEIVTRSTWKNAIIVNNATSLKYSDMLPDWTVKKFIEQVQIWQNCRFIYNPASGVVDIRYNHLNTQYAPLTYLQVLDDFTGVSEETDPIMNRQRNIDYNLPQTDVYKYTKLGDIADKFSNISTSAGTLQELINSMMINGRPDWIYLYENAKLIMREGVPAFVDEYRMLRNNLSTEGADETLDIVPAEMKLIKFYVRDRMSNANTSWIYLMVPVVRNSVILNTWINDELKNVSVNDAINDSSLVSEETGTSDVMQIIMYMGHRQTTLRGSVTNLVFDGMPEAYTRLVSDIYPEGSFHHIIASDPEVQNTLSLQFLHEHLYSQEAEINTSKLYRFRFFTPLQELDITDTFVINGEHYRAFQFNKTVNSDGMEEVIEGEFFKLK